ncbi:putative cytochrome P450 hydroxylase [Cystobacter fuscus DSM 2262]|uniref:Cytochrome P450 hydroxylase n=1 Tax=Cystobacter fuscus (strain ATCC 25194 / DSM 2262 / NBRC 100088 / M29) TaxID=1242864 RepID=S9P3Z9_CYSF2|nr:cytochrome P450 [Cystobacter fuscus]EPX57901.1 putative cytochrome P450 hydroxylase [Cystobacter fuscus DSM 2262]
MLQKTPTPDHGPDFVLDLEDPAFVRDPYPTYAWLREKAPAYRWKARGDAIVFSRHKDVRALVLDRRFSNDYRMWEFARKEEWPAEHAEYKSIMDNGLFGLADADHLRVRKLVSPAFTPRAAERMRDEIQKAVDDIIAEHVKGERVDLTTITEPLPMRVVSDMLKIPENLRGEFRAFGQASIRSSVLFNKAEELFELIAPMPRWIRMLREVIAERREHLLENDLLSTLITASDEGQKLTEDEMISLVHALIVAGSDTTVHAANWALYSLLRHPDQFSLLRDDPSLIRNTIEETLRYDLFGKGGLPKFAREEMEFAGTKLRKGQMVMPFIPAALHDPEVFPEPERFDIRRDVSQTIAFSAGQHFCLGAALARQELDLVVGTLVRRFPHMRLSQEPQLQPHPIMRALTRLEVTLS